MKILSLLIILGAFSAKAEEKDLEAELDSETKKDEVRQLTEEKVELEVTTKEKRKIRIRTMSEHEADEWVLEKVKWAKERAAAIEKERLDLEADKRLLADQQRDLQRQIESFEEMRARAGKLRKQFMTLSLGPSGQWTSQESGQQSGQLGANLHLEILQNSRQKLLMPAYAVISFETVTGTDQFDLKPVGRSELTFVFNESPSLYIRGVPVDYGASVDTFEFLNLTLGLFISNETAYAVIGANPAPAGYYNAERDITGMLHNIHAAGKVLVFDRELEVDGSIDLGVLYGKESNVNMVKEDGEFFFGYRLLATAAFLWMLHTDFGLGAEVHYSLEEVTARWTRWNSENNRNDVLSKTYRDQVVKGKLIAEFRF